MNSIRKGDIFWVENKSAVGSEQSGTRPAMVVSNDMGNENAPIVMIVWLTSRTKKQLPTHCEVKALELSTALCENIITVSKERIGEYIRTATDAEIEAVDRCIRIALGLEKAEDNSLDVLRCVLREVDSLYYTEPDYNVAKGIDRAVSVVRQIYRDVYINGGSKAW